MEVEQNLPVVEHAISEGVECQPGEEKKIFCWMLGKASIKKNYNINGIFHLISNFHLCQTLMVDILKTTLGSGQIGKKCVKIHTLA